MFERDFVVLRSPGETLKIRNASLESQPDPGTESAARRAGALLRFGIDARDPLVIDAAQRLLHLLDGHGVVEMREPGQSATSTSFLDALSRRLEAELSRGRLVAEFIAEAPLRVRGEVPEVALPPLPPPRREGPETFYEIRFIDEIGQAVSGIDVDFDAPGDVRDLTTNAGGVALAEGVKSFSATVAVPDLHALEGQLDPRWKTIRAGRFPKESNQTAVVLDGSLIGPISVRAALPNTVVIQPVFGDLLLELADKRSRIRHKNRPYKISGPIDLSGETDERGLVSHPRVPNGDYQLELDVEIDLGEESPRHESFTTSAVVLSPGGRGPSVPWFGGAAASGAAATARTGVRHQQIVSAPERTAGLGPVEAGAAGPQPEQNPDRRSYRHDR